MANGIKKTKAELLEQINDLRKDLGKKPIRLEQITRVGGGEIDAVLLCQIVDDLENELLAND